MSKRIHGYYLLLVTPLREWTDGRGRLSIGKVGLMFNVEITTCYGERMVD